METNKQQSITFNLTHKVGMNALDSFLISISEFAVVVDDFVDKSFIFRTLARNFILREDEEEEDEEVLRCTSSHFH